MEYRSIGAVNQASRRKSQLWIRLLVISAMSALSGLDSAQYSDGPNEEGLPCPITTGQIRIGVSLCVI